MYGYLEFRFQWREAGPPNHHDDKVDSAQWVDNTELSLSDLRFEVRDFLAGLLTQGVRPVAPVRLPPEREFF